MKVAFYLDNKNKDDIDLRSPNEGNPGIGGAQFMIAFIAYNIKMNKEDIDVYIYANNINKLPKEVIKKQVNDTRDLLVQAKNDSIDVLIVRTIYDLEFYKLLDNIKIKTIIWAHNFDKGHILDEISKSRFVMRYLCVSKQQYQCLRDHKVFLKSCYIYNCINTDMYKGLIQNEPKEKIICYLGAIVEGKGLEFLGDAWRKIRGESKDIKLYIIGSPKIYNKNAIMGRYGIAEQRCESKLISGFLDEDGSIDRNVFFLGEMGGLEKLKIMSKAKVGVVSPGRNRETFGLSAIEFQALGVPVVTRMKSGFLDTVENKKTGFLIKNKNQFVNYILETLDDKSNLYQKNCYEFVYRKFDVEKIIKKWFVILNDVYYNKECQIDYSLDNIWIDIKWIYELNRKIKKISIFNNIPSIHNLIELIRG